MLPLRVMVEERPTEQNGHRFAACEEIGSGVFGSVEPSAAVAMVVSNPCNAPPASACPMSPLVTPSTSSESTSASPCGTGVLLIRCVTAVIPDGDPIDPTDTEDLLLEVRTPDTGDPRKLFAVSILFRSPNARRLEYEVTGKAREAPGA